MRIATRDAPFSISALAHSLAVDPVVKTSSISMTALLSMADFNLFLTSNAPCRFLRRLARLKRVWVSVLRFLLSAFTSVSSVILARLEAISSD